MTEEKLTYITEQEHEAKKKRIEAIEGVLARYIAGEIEIDEAATEIKVACALLKMQLYPSFEATIIWD